MIRGIHRFCRFWLIYCFRSNAMGGRTRKSTTPFEHDVWVLKNKSLHLETTMSNSQSKNTVQKSSCFVSSIFLCKYVNFRIFGISFFQILRVTPNLWSSIFPIHKLLGCQLSPVCQLRKDTWETAIQPGILIKNWWAIYHLHISSELHLLSSRTVGE